MYLGLVTRRWSIFTAVNFAAPRDVGLARRWAVPYARRTGRVENTRAYGGSKVDGAVDDDCRDDDDEESDLQEHRGTAAGRRHADDSRLLADGICTIS